MGRLHCPFEIGENKKERENLRYEERGKERYGDFISKLRDFDLEKVYSDLFVFSFFFGRWSEMMALNIYLSVSYKDVIF